MTQCDLIVGIAISGQGCYHDDPDTSKRDLPYEVSGLSPLRPADCINVCKARRYMYAGVQVCYLSFSFKTFF